MTTEWELINTKQEQDYWKMRTFTMQVSGGVIYRTLHIVEKRDGAEIYETMVFVPDPPITIPHPSLEDFQMEQRFFSVDGLSMYDRKADGTMKEFKLSFAFDTKTATPK